MGQRGAEGAKFKRLRRLWGIVPVWQQGRGQARAARPYARVIRRAAQVLNGLLNAGGSALLREGRNGGRGVAQIVHVSFSKWGWGYSWGYSWGYFRGGVRTPKRTKSGIKTAIFER